MKSQWRTFWAAAFVAASFIFFGAPWLPVLAGIGAVGVWNYSRLRGSRRS